MEVKKITKTVEEVVGYIAYDGTEFKDRNECCKYEETARAIIHKRFKELIVKDIVGIDLADYGSAYVCAAIDECYHYALVRIKNENDLKVAQMYKELEHKGAERDFTTSYIGHDLIVGIGERYDCCYIYGTFEECIDNFRKAMNKFYKTETTETE